MILADATTEIVQEVIKQLSDKASAPNWLYIGIAVIGGGALSALLRYFIARRQQPIDHYEKLVTRLETRVNTLEIEHKECIKEHVQAQLKVGELNGRVIELRALAHASIGIKVVPVPVADAPTEIAKIEDKTQ